MLVDTLLNLAAVERLLPRNKARSALYTEPEKAQILEAIDREVEAWEIKNSQWVEPLAGEWA